MDIIEARSSRTWGLDSVAKGYTIEFRCSYEEDKQTKSCGSFLVTRHGDELRGEGKVFDAPVTVTGKHESIANAAPRHHEFTPTQFSAGRALMTSSRRRASWRERKCRRSKRSLPGSSPRP